MRIDTRVLCAIRMMADLVRHRDDELVALKDVATVKAKKILRPTPPGIPRHFNRGSADCVPAGRGY
jgi:hypothetical protein